MLSGKYTAAPDRGESFKIVAKCNVNSNNVDPKVTSSCNEETASALSPATLGLRVFCGAAKRFLGLSRRAGIGTDSPAP
jgi:hypothetical protein